MKPLTCLTALLALFLLAPSAFAQKWIEGRVIGVADGDTLTVLDSSNKQHRIRCQGIDAPERAQDFGEEAKKRLSGMAFGRDATVRYDKLDKYGRVVGKVIVGATDVCGEMVWSGLAWHYKQYEGEQPPTERTIYAEAEKRARGLGIGIWSKPAPTAPWDFRRAKRVDEAEVAETQPVQAAAPAGEAARPAEPAVEKTSAAVEGGILGNRNSRIYHWPGCPNYSQIAPDNRVAFASATDAEKAGYRAAKNCPDAPARQEAVAPVSTSSSSGSSGRVQVKGYYRKDGTYVRPHTRSAPRRRN